MSSSTIIGEFAGTDSKSISSYGELDVSRLVLNLVPDEEQGPVPGLWDPGRMLQKYTTAHMLQVPWAEESGWGIPEISKYGKIGLEPTASVLHYATESFVSSETRS